MANIYWWSMGWSRKDETEDLDSKFSQLAIFVSCKMFGYI